jgi:hypothetical protein
LVWCAISEAGVFTSFIGTVKGQAVDAEFYITKCLPKMVKFIKMRHKNDETILWPNLATCQYAKKNVGMVGTEQHQNSAQI